MGTPTTQEHPSNSAPLIIAMKGHPGTGKTTLARSIASSLRIPLVDKDDIRGSTLPLQNTLLQLTSPTATSSLLNDLSYFALWQVATTQLQLGLSVVVDSPLSRKTHLDRLLQMADSFGARVLIVECKPGDKAEWRRRLERRAEEESSWHKPSTWQDMEKLLDRYDGCTEYDEGDVPKMVVDTTGAVGFDEICSGVLTFIASSRGDTRGEYVRSDS